MMKKRYTAGDMYERKYTGRISRYAKEMEQRTKETERKEMARRAVSERSAADKVK